MKSPSNRAWSFILIPVFTIFAGTPTTMQLSGTSLVTIVPPPNYAFISYMNSWANKRINPNKTVITNVGIFEIIATIRLHKDMLVS